MAIESPEISRFQFVCPMCQRVIDYNVSYDGMYRYFRTKFTCHGRSYCVTISAEEVMALKDQMNMGELVNARLTSMILREKRALDALYAENDPEPKEKEPETVDLLVRPMRKIELK